jgi:GTP-binding protein YchF
MGLTCGLIGVPSCGKTVIFNAITAARVPLYNGSEMNRVIVNLPDERMDRLVAMYHPRKVVPATMEIVDTAGIRPLDDGRRSRLVSNIKDVEALLHVVRCFEDEQVPFEYNTIDPVRDVETVDLEMMASDVATLQNKLERIGKKARSGEKDAVRELGHCQKVLAGIQDGTPARRQELTPQEMASIKECNLVSAKPTLYVANIKTIADADNRHVQALKQVAAKEGTETIVVCGKDEADISELEPEDRKIFLKELGIDKSAMELLLQAAYRKLGLINFFTTGEDEVRAWTCRSGDKAPVAAGKIHSDMEAGFIRMEVTKYADLIELGSESAAVKAGKQHLEGREYEVQDGDIVMVLFNARH